MYVNLLYYLHSVNHGLKICRGTIVIEYVATTL